MQSIDQKPATPKLGGRKENITSRDPRKRQIVGALLRACGVERGRVTLVAMQGDHVMGHVMVKTGPCWRSHGLVIITRQEAGL